MTEISENADKGRRNFLKLATVAAPAAVAAASLGADGGRAEAATVSASGEPRLANTTHARAFYDSARF